MTSMPVPRNMYIQSAAQKLNVDFFTDEEVMKIFSEIDIKIREDKRRSDKHKRYFLLVKFLYRTGARIDEILILKPLDINLATNTIRLKTLKLIHDLDHFLINSNWQSDAQIFGANIRLFWHRSSWDRKTYISSSSYVIICHHM